MRPPVALLNLFRRCFPEIRLSRVWQHREIVSKSARAKSLLAAHDTCITPLYINIDTQSSEDNSSLWNPFLKLTPNPDARKTTSAKIGIETSHELQKAASRDLESLAYAFAVIEKSTASPECVKELKAAIREGVASAVCRLPTALEYKKTPFGDLETGADDDDRNAGHDREHAAAV